jgi:hypothetical protein
MNHVLLNYMAEVLTFALCRHDIREGNSGVDMYLDIGVIDVETCEP